MSVGERCDAILQLIDAALGEYEHDSTPDVRSADDRRRAPAASRTVE